VIWVGIGAGAAAVCEFQRGMEAKITGLGFREDPRGFSPHVTIARAGASLLPPNVLEGFSGPRLDFAFGECVLFHSILGPRGPTYLPLATITFDRGKL
jgi:2'-5' RNA ligase